MYPPAFAVYITLALIMILLFLSNLPYTLTQPMYREYENKCRELERWNQNSRYQKVKRYLREREAIQFIFALGIYYRYVVAPLFSCANFFERLESDFEAGLTVVGIEHVEAVPENHVRASIYRQKGVGPQVHLLEKHQPGELSRSNNTILNDIIRDKASSPWVGNEVEVDWAKVMLHFIDAKVKIIYKSGFAKFEENLLLIYNNWPLPGVHHEEACSLLTNSFPNKILPSEFNRVFILDSKVLCEFGKRTRLHLVKPPSAGA